MIDIKISTVGFLAERFPDANLVAAELDKAYERYVKWCDEISCKKRGKTEFSVLCFKRFTWPLGGLVTKKYSPGPVGVVSAYAGPADEVCVRWTGAPNVAATIYASDIIESNVPQGIMDLALAHVRGSRSDRRGTIA